MRIAILSDIHSNQHAIEAVLADAGTKSIDKYYCLGDIVGYGAFPRKCVEIIKNACEKVVFGNHDYAITYPGLAATFHPYARKAIEYTQVALDKPEKEWIKTLESHLVLDGLTIAHGSLRDFNEYIHDTEIASYSLAALSTPVLFVGHTHHPKGFFLDNETGTVEEISLPVDGPLELTGNRKYIINAGSVGQPRDGDPRAAYVIYDPEALKVELIRVQYDNKAASKAVGKAGLSESLAKRLLTGK